MTGEVADLIDQMLFILYAQLLFPAGTSSEEIEAALKGDSMPTSFPTIREEETPTPSDATTDSQPDPIQATQGTEVPE